MKVKKVMYILPCILSLIISLVLHPFGLAHASTSIKEIDIVTSPEKVLFNVSKLVPGDWANRTITIKNTGKQDFNYISSAKFISGSEKLYKELILVISDKDKELYKGKLSAFNKLEPRFIGRNSNEELTFKIEIPYSLGNEYQGLESNFEFRFYVDGTLGGVLPANGPKLPATGSNMFNILLAGSVLVLGGTILQFFLKRRSRLDRHS